MSEAVNPRGALSSKELSQYKSIISSAPRVIFHRFSHLDDAACQWFLRFVVGIPGEFVFMPNNAIVVDQSAGEIGLDVVAPGAVKGYQHADGSYSSAFRFVVEVFFPEDCKEKRALEPLVRWVDGDDNTGAATKAILGEEHELIETVGLTNQFQAYKSVYSSHGDAVINQKYAEYVLQPLYLHLLMVEEAKEVVMNTCELYQSGCVAVCIGHVPAPARGYPQSLLVQRAIDEGFNSPKIFLYRDPKMGLGMIRIIDDIRLDEPDLKKFIDQYNSSEWFFHPGGFMAACGSGTTPRNPETIPVPTDALIAMLNQIYGG